MEHIFEILGNFHSYLLSLVIASTNEYAKCSRQVETYYLARLIWLLYMVKLRKTALSLTYKVHDAKFGVMIDDKGFVFPEAVYR